MLEIQTQINDLNARLNGLLRVETPLFYDGTKVGIGVSTPLSKFHVQDTQIDARLTWTDTTQYGRLLFYENTTLKGSLQVIGSTYPVTPARQNAVELLNTSATGVLSLWTNTTQRLTIDSSGNVGIGTASPRKPLDVSGQILATDAIRAEGYNNPPTGEGLEIGYISGIGYVTSFKRTDSTWKPLVLRGSTTTIQSSNVDALTISGTGILESIVTDSGTAGSNQIITRRRTSATPVANFGVDFPVILHTSTNVDANAFLKRVQWATATNGSQKAQVTFFVYDTAARNTIRMEASGTAAMIGFLGANPIARPTVTGSRGGNAALASALTALANLGLITDSSTA